MDPQDRLKWDDEILAIDVEESYINAQHLKLKCLLEYEM